jgi:hypothetical protein
MKKLLMAVTLVALMGTAAFAQQPANQAKTTTKTETVAKKHHPKKKGSKTTAAHKHATHKHVSDSTSVKH